MVTRGVKEWTDGRHIYIYIYQRLSIYSVCTVVLLRDMSILVSTLICTKFARNNPQRYLLDVDNMLFCRGLCGYFGNLVIFVLTTPFLFGISYPSAGQRERIYRSTIYCM